MTDSTVQLVCFDLGGVLVRICRTWEEACARIGLEVRHNAAWMENRPARRALTQQYGIGGIDGDSYARRISELMGGLYSPAEITRVHDAWTIEDYPGVFDLLARLNATGIPTACLSNTNHGHWVRLAHEENGRPRPGPPEFPVVRLIQHRHASHLMGLAKPDPAIHTAFEQAMKVEPSGILFFDDLEENVAAARQAGWIARQIDYRSDTAPQIESHLRELGLL